MVSTPGWRHRACLRANHVPSGSPGDRAGIRVGDILVGINERPVSRVAPLVREMFRSGIWAHATLLHPAAIAAYG